MNSTYVDSKVSPWSKISWLHLPSTASKILQFFDVYVQASYSESFGRSVAEAMACGKPVIVFNVGGLSETIGWGGLLVPNDDSESFVKSVVWLLQNPDAVSKVGAEARKQALKYEFFSRERRLVEIYREALGEKEHVLYRFSSHLQT